MFRITKNETEVLIADEDEGKIRDSFLNLVVNVSSNGDELSCGDREDIRESNKERVGPNVYEIDEVLDLSDKEIVEKQGNICFSCHSKDVDEEDIIYHEGEIERIVVCNCCGKETIERYEIVGRVKD